MDSVKVYLYGGLAGGLSSQAKVWSVPLGVDPNNVSSDNDKVKPGP